MNLLILFGIRRSCLRSRRSRSLCLYVRRVIKDIVVIIGAYKFCQLHTKFYSTSCCQDYLNKQRKYLGIIGVDFDATCEMMIIRSASVKYSRENGNK
jgi:hypothetical protein